MLFQGLSKDVPARPSEAASYRKPGKSVFPRMGKGLFIKVEFTTNIHTMVYMFIALGYDVDLYLCLHTTVILVNIARRLQCIQVINEYPYIV